MKFMILFVSLLSFAALAVEPGPTPTDTEEKKIEAIRQGGAIKVEKQPVHIEGLAQEAANQKAVKKTKKVKKVEEKKEETHH